MPEGEASELEKKILKAGIDLRKKRDLDGALKRFDDVLGLNPRSAAAHYEKAITLQLLGKKDEAFQEYKKALEIDSTYRMRREKGAEKEEKVEKVEEPASYKVGDVMTKDIVSVPFGTTVQAVAEVMLRKGISSVAVRGGRKIIGIVTERDFIKNYRLISGRDYADIPIKDLVSYPLIAIPADSSLEEAARQMGKQGVRHLLVREGDDIVGLISLRDLLATYPKLIKNYMK